MATTYLVRIKPLVPRKTHVIFVGGNSHTFHKDKGWYNVPKVVADAAAEERVNDMDPNSPLVFDVTDKDEASRVVQKERRAAVGTLDRPQESTGTVQTPVVEEPKQARLKPRAPGATG